MLVFRMRPMDTRSPFRSPFRWDPWQEIEDVRRALDLINARTARREPVREGVGATFAPEADLYDAGGAFVVRMDVPGVKPEALEISIEGSTLAIRGHRDADGPEGEGYLCCERRIGRFARMIELPGNVDVEGVRAALSHGVLEIMLPKSKTAAARKVTVTIGKQS